MEDQQIIQLYWDRLEQAIVESERKYDPGGGGGRGGVRQRHLAARLERHAPAAP